MDYIDRMVAIRTDADDTQRSLGKELGISYSQWAAYERRAHELPIRYLIKFCKHYGVSEIGRASCRERVFGLV